jgi:thiol-disulfide isomerase/thioredoxin
MKYLRGLRITARAIALAILTSQQPCIAADTNSTDKDFAFIGERVLQLLNDGDANAFALAVSPTSADWQTVKFTNALRAQNPDLERQLDYQRQQVADTAKQLLDRARQLGIELSRMRFTIKDVNSPRVGETKSPSRESLPWAATIKVLLAGEPKNENEAGNKFRDEYEVAVEDVTRFTTGWRCDGGVRWLKFPESVLDERTRSEMTILERVAEHKSLTGAEDPALLDLGEDLIELLRTQDANLFISNATLSANATWRRMEEEGDKRKIPSNQRPSRAAFDERWTKMNEQMLQSAREVLGAKEKYAIDFSSAKLDLKSVIAENVYPRGAAGSIDGLSAGSIVFNVRVKSDAKAKTGTSLSGDYAVRTGRAMRTGDRWALEQPIAWLSFPTGVVDKAELERIDFENYVAKNRTLPPKTIAPDIEFIDLASEKKVKLSDYRGQLVVIDFWATWCGPCQEPMADLQKTASNHPEWKNRVKLLSLSLDSDEKKLRKHLADRGWTNTVNTWAGPGAWEAESAKAFRIQGVPTTYIIGADGKIIVAGHPAGMRIEETITASLK